MIRRTQVAVALVALAICAAWWTAYGAPASKFFRAQNALREAAMGPVSSSTPLANVDTIDVVPEVSVHRMALAGSVRSSYADFYVNCSYHKLLRDAVFPVSAVWLEAMGKTGERHETVILDSIQVSRVASLIDRVLAGGDSMGRVGTATTIRGEAHDVGVVATLGAGGLAGTLALEGEPFFLELNELRRLGVLLSAGWSTCRAKTPR